MIFANHINYNNNSTTIQQQQQQTNNNNKSNSNSSNNTSGSSSSISATHHHKRKTPSSNFHNSPQTHTLLVASSSPPSYQLPRQLQPHQQQTPSSTTPTPQLSTSLNFSEHNSRYVSDFDSIRRLGRGGFGVVFEARNKIDDCHYAVKRICLPLEKEARDRVMREVRALAKLDHSGIVRYYNAWLETPPEEWLRQHDAELGIVHSKHGLSFPSTDGIYDKNGYGRLPSSSLSSQNHRRARNENTATTTQTTTSSSSTSSSLNYTTSNDIFNYTTNNNNNKNFNYNYANNKQQQHFRKRRNFGKCRGDALTKTERAAVASALKNTASSCSLEIVFEGSGSIRMENATTSSTATNANNSFLQTCNDSNNKIFNNNNNSINTTLVNEDGNLSSDIDDDDDFLQFKPIKASKTTTTTNQRHHNNRSDDIEDCDKVSSDDDTSSNASSSSSSDTNDDTTNARRNNNRHFNDDDDDDSDSDESLLALSAVRLEDLSDPFSSSSESAIVDELKANGVGRDGGFPVNGGGPPSSSTSGFKSGSFGNNSRLSSSKKNALQIEKNVQSLASSALSENLHTENIYLYIQMQLCRKDTLKDWLRTNSEERDKITIFDIFYQIVDAVEYVHSQGMIHRDLKPSNIFFSMDGIVKIGDFGLATAKSTGLGSSIDLQEYVAESDAERCFEAVHTKQVGTQLYMSPEQLNGISYNHKVDIFAMGLILLELLVPFKTQMQRVSVLFKARNNLFSDDFKRDFPKEYDLVKSLLMRNPQKRPTATEIKHNDLLSNAQLSPPVLDRINFRRRTISSASSNSQNSK